MNCITYTENKAKRAVNWHLSHLQGDDATAHQDREMPAALGQDLIPKKVLCAPQVPPQPHPCC